MRAAVLVEIEPDGVVTIALTRLRALLHSRGQRIEIETPEAGGDVDLVRLAARALGRGRDPHLVAAWGALTLGAAVGRGAALATALTGALAAGLVATGWGCFSARYLGLSPFQLALSLLKRRRASASVMRPASAALGSRMRDPTRMWLMLPSAKLLGFLS